MTRLLRGLLIAVLIGAAAARAEAQVVRVGGGSGGASLPVIDTTAVVKGSGDPTKQVRFEVDGLTTATTRVLTVPDADITLAGIGLDNAFSVSQTIGGASGAANSCTFNGTGFICEGTAADANELTITTGNPLSDGTLTFSVDNSNGVSIVGSGAGVRIGNMIATGNSTNAVPNGSYLFNGISTTDGVIRAVTESAGNNYALLMANNNTYQANVILYGSSYSGTLSTFAGLSAANLAAVYSGTTNALAVATTAAAPVVTITNQAERDYVEDGAKTLTESSATAVVRINVASGSYGSGRIQYTVYAADASDKQSRSGAVTFQVVNKAGTETCTVGGASETADGSALASSAGGTLTYAITTDTAPTNGCDIKFNAVSSLTQTTFKIVYRVSLDTDDATTNVTPQ